MNLEKGTLVPNFILTDKDGIQKHPGEVELCIIGDNYIIQFPQVASSQPTQVVDYPFLEINPIVK